VNKVKRGQRIPAEMLFGLRDKWYKRVAEGERLRLPVIVAEMSDVTKMQCCQKTALRWLEKMGLMEHVDGATHGGKGNGPLSQLKTLRDSLEVLAQRVAALERVLQ
jgi:hypothetical protein